MNELGGATTPGAPHGGAGGAAGQAAGGGLAGPGRPHPAALGRHLLDPEGHWVVSTQSTRYRNSRTEVETLLRQRMRGLRSVSFQLPCEEDVLQSAFEDKPLCVAPAAGRAAAAECGGGVRRL